jgi:predicted O-methyltransferase YrrM
LSVRSHNETFLVEPSVAWPLEPMSKFSTAVIEKPSNERQFSRDSFTANIPRWEIQLAKFAGQSDLEFLEIGSYEGRSTLWLLEHFSTAHVHCLDTFEGAVDERASNGCHLPLNWLLRRFTNNVSSYSDRVHVHVGVSQEILRGLGVKPSFDFIYIDGSHAAPDVLEDAVLAFRLLKPGGRMIFDDYGWHYYQDELLNPQVGVEAFLQVFAGQLAIIDIGYQVCIERL